MPMIRSPISTIGTTSANSNGNESENTFTYTNPEGIHQIQEGPEQITDEIDKQLEGTQISEGIRRMQTPESIHHVSQEQETSQINKRLEDMQMLLLNQMRSMQKLMETNNLNTQISITALKENLRIVESNVVRNYSSLSEISLINSNVSTNNVATITNSTASSNVIASDSIPLSASYASNSNVNTFNSIPSGSSFVSSQPIVHASPFVLHSTQTNSSQSLSNHRQKKIYPLPKFSGLPEDWQTFYESFTTSTQEFEYSELHNIMRLRESLEGDARESVESLLVSSKNVDAIIKTLSEMFGRPEQLIKSQIQKVRSLPTVSESDLTSLIHFANKVGNMTTFLESVGGSYHLSNPLLLSELLNKLPLSKRLQWAEKCLSLDRIVTISDFSIWLSNLRRISNMVTDASPLPDIVKENRKYACIVLNKKCKLCDGECKSLVYCKTFLDFSIDKKWQTVLSLKACFCCLKFGHHAKSCYSRKKCEVEDCGKIHHSLLHKNILLEENFNSPKDVLNITHQQARSCLIDVDSSVVLFQIIPVYLYGPKGSEKIYAFVDDGANVSILDSEIVQKLGISGQKDTLELQWINHQISREQTQIIDVELSGIEEESLRYKMKNVYVSTHLDLPSQSLNTSNYDFKRYNLSADISHCCYNQIKPKMIISLAHAFLTVPIETPKFLSPNGLIVTKTRLGWIIYGNLNNSDYSQKSFSCHLGKKDREEFDSDNELDVLMKSYFGMETFGIRHFEPLLSENDERALEVLKNTTKRTGSRFESGLIWRKDFKLFPGSYNMALKRLNTVERKMLLDPIYAKEYCEKIEEYLKKGYARILSEEEASRHSNKTFYLPHFGVKNPNKKKFRFVFDAAAEVENMSLNKALLAGPDLNQPLQMVLFKFRQAPIAVCGDLKEMFHQVGIIPEDQDALRFLWRKGNTCKTPDIYVMQRMIFGAACSPTTAQYVKNKNAEDYVKKYPQAAASIIEKHYVDDYVDCFDSEQEAINVVKAVKLIHEAGGFQMHNVITNSEVVAKALEISYNDEVKLSSDKIERILGMHWTSHSDCFIFVLKFHKVPKNILELKTIPSKRQFLSIAMSIFDPFGFVADFVIVVKILMQEVWRSSIDWDSKVPNSIYEKFKLWLQEIPKIGQFKIPRFYFREFKYFGNLGIIELHVFCDASEEALAVVGYWRVIMNSGSKLVFITGKTACAPIRFHSIPKLELQAAVMAARLKETIVKCHDRLKPEKIVFWTDSHTVIRWIRSDHRKYKQYVANRVSEILDNSEIYNWRWCPTSENPADVATRAKFPINYNPEGRWKKGPEFLLVGEDKWPDENGMGNKEDKSDEFLKPRHVVLLAQDLNVIEATINRFSKFLKVLRVMSWVIRFYKNIIFKLNSGRKIEGELTMDELSEAENKIVRCIQKKHFSNEYNKLTSKQNIDISSVLKTLNPYVDEIGLLRVGGRLDNASILSSFAKRPLILPKNDRFSCLLVEFYHTKNCHQNIGNVMGDIRQKYWIPSLRSLIRSIENKCNVCKIRKARPIQPQMGILPVDRVTPFVKPFSYAGVDLFGPFDIKIRRCQEKRWVALFTCLTIRAIHVEVVTDLSTDSFLLCLRNFVNRRGTPIQIRSDNGRNFVGIKKELKNELFYMDYNAIVCSSTPLGIKWIFNTPYDPSSGGVWERLIQSVKKTLSILLGNIIPRLDVFISLLIECENIVNSRPLTHIPVSPYEPEPISPNHFLLGGINSTQAPSNFDPKLICLKKQWRILQNLKNGFWKRWIKEYLPELTRRVKWCLPSASLQVSALVLICDESVSRSKWRRGRVVRIYADKFGTARSADIKTCDGLLKRPVSKLAVLDIANE